MPASVASNSAAAARAGPPHTHTWLACASTARVEGLRGLQRGLATAVVREALLNFFRVGMFEPVLRAYHPEGGRAPLWKKIAAGITTGATAALVANPLARRLLSIPCHG